MKKHNQKCCSIGCILMAFITLMMLAGCGKEITEAEITASKVYQDLDTKYTSLQRKYDKLKSNTTESETEDTANVDAAAYFKKIKKSLFTKVRYGQLVDSMSYKVSDNLSLCKWLKGQLGNAIAVTNVNVDEYTSEQEAKYHYTLYNEDNSVCECQVYEGDYVIFSDLPDMVYYVSEVTRLGQGAFADTTKLEKPVQSVYADLYDSQLVYSDGELLSREQGQLVASQFYQCKHKKLKEKPADVEGTSEREYIFLYDGTTYVMEVYLKYFSITKNGNEITWYRSNATDVQRLLNVLDTD